MLINQHLSVSLKKKKDLKWLHIGVVTYRQGDSLKVNVGRESVMLQIPQNLSITLSFVVSICYDASLEGEQEDFEMKWHQEPSGVKSWRISNVEVRKSGAHSDKFEIIKYVWLYLKKKSS